MVIDKKYMHLVPIDSLTVRALNVTKAHQIEEIFTGLTLKDGTLLRLGDSVIVNNLSFKINTIKPTVKNDLVYYDLQTARKTKASIFILPMLGKTKGTFFYDTLLLNVFIKVPHKSNYYITLLYHDVDSDVFRKFKGVMANLPTYVEDYKPTDDHIVFLFKVPIKFKSILTKFIKGQYSKMTDFYKSRILAFHKQSLKGFVGQVLFKSSIRKNILEAKLGAELPVNSEVLSVPTLKEETLDTKYYF
jgi:hypothetical protein